MGRELIMRVPDPFDGTAEVRLGRMGLIAPDGTISKEAMAVFVRLYAALFFDDLCDFYDDAEKLGTILHTFQSLDAKGDYQHKLPQCSVSNALFTLVRLIHPVTPLSHDYTTKNEKMKR